MTKRLLLIMGDQLSRNSPVLAEASPDTDIIVMGELSDEATTPRHHKKKIAFIFSAMRHFAKSLQQDGFTVLYQHFDTDNGAATFEALIRNAADQTGLEDIVMLQASEYRVRQWQTDFADKWHGHVTVLEDSRFLATHDDFSQWANGKKQLRMEFFYREMRRKFNILMSDDKPIGGQWNYDSENRKPPKSGLTIPARTTFIPDEITEDVLALVDDYFDDHFGTLKPFDMAVTRDEALHVFECFIKERLMDFGNYQDAMITDEPFMYHAHIGAYLNIGLLSPLEVIKRAEFAYHHEGAPLNAVEGFIRQILGWREYIRGIYWQFMPNYAAQNALGASRALPGFFWHGKTRMNCLHQSISQTIDFAYAHHIQRLMVIGNFSLLAGLSPAKVNEWFLIVYSDAFEWVEMPNVTGMVLFADDGIVASKPYAAGGNYIDKMSDYCKGCHYNIKEKTGENACPFHYLYWDFLWRHEEKLRSNPRLGMIYRTADKMGPEKKQTIRNDAQKFLSSLS
ncbi:MAG: cryptochrome/photolyase family protein [Candidatus Puniceispirillaceae bacterium]